MKVRGLSRSCFGKHRLTVTALGYRPKSWKHSLCTIDEEVIQNGKDQMDNFFYPTS
jgi:hypothetical protein